MGAIVLNGAEIGEFCMIGAGALVTQNKKFPDGMLIIGSPAKAVRELTEEEKQIINAYRNATSAEQEIIKKILDIKTEQEKLSNSKIG